jgi:hypothetical protein
MYHLEKKETLFLKTFGWTFFITFFLVISFNYISDSFLIFHQQPTLFQASFEPNSRVLKTKYLGKNCNRFDAMIFGTSRAVAYQTKDINQQFGVRSYNFGVAEETPQRIMKKLEWLDSKNCIPKTVFLPVSSDSTLFLRDSSKKPFNLVTMEHPWVVKKKSYWLDFLITYLTSRTVTAINTKKQLNYYGTKTRFRYDMTGGDVYYLWEEKFPISECARSYRTSSDKIPPGFTFQPGEVAAQLIKIKKFAEERGSQIVLIWNPLPLDFQIKNLDKTEILLKNLSHHFQYLYRLPLNDKKLLSPVSYHDRSHFKASIAREVIILKNKTFVRVFLDELKKHQGTCDLMN